MSRLMSPISPVMTAPAWSAALSSGATPKPRRCLREGGRNAEEASDRTCLCPPFRDRPRDHDLVADVLVDLAVGVGDRVRGEPEHLVQEPVDGGGPDALGQRRRAGDIDEEEEPFLEARPMVAREHDVAQDAPSYNPADLEHEEHGERCREGEDDGEPLERGLEASRTHARAEEQYAGTLHVDRGDDHAVDEPLHAEGDQERGSLERASPTRLRQ